MAQKVLPTYEAFLDFKMQLEKWGFKEIGKVDFKSDFVRLGLVAPRKKFGRERGFEFRSHHHLTVVVWTGFLADENVAREEDSGWVLIKEGDKSKYFAHPFRRTKYFFRNILRRAWISKFKAENRPRCKECEAYMDIQRGKGIGSYYWRCNKIEKHLDKKPTRESWDFKLPPKALSFVKTVRSERKDYRDKRRSQGKPAGNAPIIRKKWKLDKPENVV